jgi:hypothetical protein
MFVGICNGPVFSEKVFVVIVRSVSTMAATAIPRLALNAEMVVVTKSQR